MKRNFSISEQAKILFESIEYPIRGFVIFFSITLCLIVIFILIQLSSSTTQSTKVVATGERHYKIHQNQEHHIVYFDVDGEEYDTEAYSDSIPAQISVHYFAFFPFVFPTPDIDNEHGEVAGFVLYEALIDKCTWLIVTPVWIGFLPFLILLVWFFWALNRGFWYIRIAQNGELNLGTFQYKPFSETEIDKENG